MKTEIRTTPIKDLQADVLIVPMFEGDDPKSGRLGEIDEATGGALSALAESGELRGRRDERTYLHGPSGLQAGRLLLVGMGRLFESGFDQLRRAVGVGVRFMRGKRHASVAVLDTGLGDPARFGRTATEAAHVAALDLSLYKTEDRDDLNVEHLLIVTFGDRADGVARGVERGEVVARGMDLTRSVGNEPSDRMTPIALADQAVSMAASVGLGHEVLDEQQMKDLGMGALLGVAKGSEQAPRLIILEHNPENASGETVALVGKGITFDSGGISIKPREGMDWMKYDMCGGGAVLGAMRAIAEINPNRRVLGLIAAAENMPSGRSYKPGDVLRSYSGKTIEVLNTDAEGRLVLADALTYAKEKGADRIVDLATLTGACVIALGHVYAGLMANDDPWAEEVLRAAARSGEKIWQLPMDRAYRELIRSDIADIKNLGGRTAGTITAGYFLREFVGDTPWVHLDIAGTAWVEDERPDIAKGATGFGVPTLVELVAPTES